MKAHEAFMNRNRLGASWGGPRVQGPRVQGIGFRVQGIGFRV